MKKRNRKRLSHSRRIGHAGRNLAFAVTALIAVAVLTAGAWHFGLFRMPLTAKALSPTPTPQLTLTPEPTPGCVSLPPDQPASTPDIPVTSAPESTAEPTAEPIIDPTTEPTVVPGNPMATTIARVITIESVERGPFSGVKIGIDPGHQEHGNSAQEPVAPGSSETKAKVSGGTQGVATRIPEYEVTLQVALLLRDALEAEGAEVYLTREVNEIDISNIERATMMNELGVDVVLRLHCNGATNQSLRGIGLYVKSTGDGAEASYAISEYLIAAMGGATGAPTEPIHVRDNYSGLNWSTVPSILVEMGYMSNPEEDRLLCSESYQALLVQGMVRGLENYFADHPVPAPTAASTPTAMPEAVGE